MSDPKIVCTACEKVKPVKLSKLGCYLCDECIAALEKAGVL